MACLANLNLPFVDCLYEALLSQLTSSQKDVFASTQKDEIHSIFCLIFFFCSHSLRAKEV